MAKSFSNIKKSLGLLDFIPIGKYKQCRVDSIIEQDHDYLIFMDSEKILVFAPEVIDRLKNKFSADSIEVTYDDVDEEAQYSSEDIPF